MSKVDVWMPIYIGDYLRDTTELSGTEHGSYLLLLMHYWMKRGEIGCDVERLSRVCRSDVETCRFILGYYFTLENGNYKNKRADKEMQNAENRRLASSENGKKGGRPSKNNLEKTHRFSVGIPRHNLDETYAEPRSNLDHNLEKSSSPSSSPSYKNQQTAEIGERDTETDDDGFGEDSGESALPPAAASYMTQGVGNSQGHGGTAMLRDALASSGLSSSFTSRELEAVSEYLATQGLDTSFVTWAIGKAREPSVRNPGGFLKSALTGRGDFADFPERYREERYRDESRPQQQEPQRSRAPSTCPKCGKKLKATSDRAACKACGLMLEYDESLDDWAEADEGLAAGADQVLAAIGVRR